MNSEAIYRVNTPKKWVALTFDIGWGGTVAPKVLEILRKHDVRHATFFLSGPVIEKRPYLARVIAKNGYEIGSHGYLHENFTEHSKQWIRSQVRLAEKVLKSSTGTSPNLIRTPNGDMNAAVIRQLSGMGYRTIHWSVDSLDWKNPGVATIVRNVVSKAGAGDIILLHASDSAKQTAAALPRIIRTLRLKGLKMVSVTQLLRSAKRVT